MENYKSIPSPCYVLEEQLLRKNLELIKSVKERANIDIILAFKGFSMWGVFPIIREYINGATASSLHEVKLCFEEMKTLSHTYAPVYSESEIHEIIEKSSHITFNSLSQYNLFYPIIKNSGRKVSIGLRVNPEYSEVETDLYNPCEPGSRLGITCDKFGDKLPEGVEGLHFHALCESNSYDLEKTLAAFTERFGKFLPQIKWVNMGGGHLMTKQGYDIEHLIKLLVDFKKKYSVNIILEPGSAFAWQTGFLYSKVLDIVENHGITTAMLDVSFTAHMPDCLEMPYKPKVREAFEPDGINKPYRLGGNTCLSGDYMGDWCFKNDLQIGDAVIFEDMIHYTMVKTSTFNGVPHPSIGIIKTNGGFSLLKKFDYENFKNRLS
ncbi:MAG: carboxynorspermidine decarboxylase [Opitutaceae bacterium]|nr:carboxynorspermidine decarboxylase [Cytophagales bacterium]